MYCFLIWTFIAANDYTKKIVTSNEIRQHFHLSLLFNSFSIYQDSILCDYLLRLCSPFHSPPFNSNRCTIDLFPSIIWLFPKQYCRFVLFPSIWLSIELRFIILHFSISNDEDRSNNEKKLKQNDETETANVIDAIRAQMLWVKQATSDKSQEPRAKSQDISTYIYESK